MPRTGQGSSAATTAPAEDARRQLGRRRHAILVAAREVFLARGYAAHDDGRDRRAAGVAVDTVYELVGRKPELFRLLIETAISGQDRAVPPRSATTSARSRPSRPRRASSRIYARRAARAARSARAAGRRPAGRRRPRNRELAELWHEIAERRAANMHRFAAELEAPARLAFDVDRAADVIWATNSPELYPLLVQQRAGRRSATAPGSADSWVRLLVDDGTSANG